MLIHIGHGRAHCANDALDCKRNPPGAVSNRPHQQGHSLLDGMRGQEPDLPGARLARGVSPTNPERFRGRMERIARGGIGMSVAPVF